jgi:hypothetical protein
VKRVAQNSARMKSLPFMKNIPRIEDLDVVGNNNINKTEGYVIHLTLEIIRLPT